MFPLSYRSPKTEVRESAIHGHGLFATGDISKDEIVTVKGGHIVDGKALREKITPVLAKTMQHWQQDTDLAGVRDAQALADLPEAERQSWQKLWSDVANLLKQAKEKPPSEKKADTK